jgi:hypothetical protein
MGDTENTEREDHTATVVAGLLLVPAILVAFLVLDWDSIAAKIAFCIVVPSVLGNLVAAAARSSAS